MAVLNILFAILVVSHAALARGLTDSVKTESGSAKLSANNSCSNCTQLLELFTGMISSTDNQELLKTALEAVCQLVPDAEPKSICLEQVEKNLPVVIGFLTNLIKPGQVCMVLGLCSFLQTEGKKEELFNNRIGESSGVSKEDPRLKVQISPPCTFCVFLINKLENLLPKERTEDEIVKLMGEVCDLIPVSYKNECKNFIDNYGKEVVEFLLSSAAPHTICTLLHLCLIQERPILETDVPSDCHTCRTLATLAKVRFGSNATELQASTFLESFCQLYPQALTKCEVFTQRYKPSLQKVLGKPGGTLDLCEKADLCVAVKEMEKLKENHCTWGMNYICSDDKIALECDSLSFCQKYVWIK